MTSGDSGQRLGEPPIGYRLPEEAHVGRVVLQVADLDRSVEFYATVLGLRQGDRGGASPDRWARLSAKDDTRSLIELRERPGARRVPRRGLLGLFHFAILVPNRPTLGRFLRHIVDRQVPLGAADHMVSEALYLTDPDGLGIEVYRDRPKADWIVRNGLVMGGSDPIDSSGLLDAARGAEFDGMPAGTQMGHVHFHVGDLEVAGAFYHAALGFDRVPWPLPGALFLSAGGYHHHVGLNVWAAGSPAANDQDARLLEWELRVPSAADVGAAASSLAAAGYDVAAGMEDAMSSDPWGITVRIRAQSDPA